MRKLTEVMLATAVASAATAQVARAADVKILTTGAMRAVVLALQPEIEKQTGHRLTIDNGTAGGLGKRIAEGEAFDVAVITPPIVDDLIRRAKIVPGSRVDLARVGMGVAVKEGAALPDIGTVEAFKHTLLAAKSVAYTDPKNGGTSGIYFDKLLDRLGIGDQVRPRAKLKQGGYVAELVVSGEAEVAVHQISEIVPVEGAVLVGPLPAEVQNITVYCGGLGAGARDPAAAKAVLAVLAGPASASILEAKGMEKL